MHQINIPTEQEIRRWIREELEVFFQNNPVSSGRDVRSDEQLNKKQITRILEISLVTLHEWMKKGLPCHRDGGRVYFVLQEVLEYIKDHNVGKRKSTGQLHYLSAKLYRKSA